MRISDWSSDVCSSDLKAELKAGTERMFSVADHDRHGDLSLIELSEWAAVWLGGQSAVPGRFDFDRDQDDRISRTEFVAELERRFAGFDADKDGRVDRRELRSEEPASELQSLMRISFAVLCLQKQKN